MVAEKAVMFSSDSTLVDPVQRLDRSLQHRAAAFQQVGQRAASGCGSPGTCAAAASVAFSSGLVGVPAVIWT